MSLKKDWTCDKCGSTKFNMKMGGVVCRKCRKFFDYALYPDQQLNPAKVFLEIDPMEVDRIIDECLKEDPWTFK